MSVKVIVTCDRCGEKWEAVGGFSSRWLGKKSVNFCENCDEKYRAMLSRSKDISEAEIQEFFEREANDYYQSS